MDERQRFTLGLSRIPKLGNVSIRELLESKSIDALVVDDVWRQKINWDEVSEIEKALQDSGINYICVWEAGYPQNLRHISDPPPILFYIGDLERCNDTELVSVVGARKVDHLGKQITRDLTAGLVDQGVGIVSGMAIGVDSIAHEAALDGDGFTIAVLASSPDSPTPVENSKLYQRILSQNGLVVSEYMPGMPVTAWMFAHRNRIIAGLSKHTLVTQAGEKSGSLITATCAIDFGRNVYAVPYSPYQLSGKGCNNLIQQGAKLTSSASDILIDMGVIKQHNIVKISAQAVAVSADQREILNIIKQNGRPMSLEEITTQFDKKLQDIISLLMDMQLNNILVQLADGKYFLC